MMKKKIVLLIVSFFVLVATAPGILAAEEASQDEGWKFGAEIYLWGASIGGESASGADIDIDFDDLLKNLRMAFMGTVGARKGKYTADGRVNAIPGANLPLPPWVPSSCGWAGSVSTVVPS